MGERWLTVRRPLAVSNQLDVARTCVVAQANAANDANLTHSRPAGRVATTFAVLYYYDYYYCAVVIIALVCFWRRPLTYRPSHSFSAPQTAGG